MYDLLAVAAFVWLCVTTLAVVFVVPDVAAYFAARAAESRARTRTARPNEEEQWDSD